MLGFKPVFLIAVTIFYLVACLVISVQALQRGSYFEFEVLIMYPMAIILPVLTYFEIRRSKNFMKFLDPDYDIGWIL